MPTYNKLNGNIIEVIDALGINTDFYAPQNLNEYYEQANQDIGRTAFVNFNGSIGILKNMYLDTSHLYDFFPRGLIRISEKNLSQLSDEGLKNILPHPSYILFEKKIYYYNLENEPKLIDIPVKYDDDPHVDGITDRVINEIFPQDFDTVKLASINNLDKLQSRVIPVLEENGKLKDVDRPLSWTQGFCDGRFFTGMILDNYNFIKKIEGINNKDYLDKIEQNIIQKKIFSSVQSIGFSFLDDNNKLSSFSIGFLRDDSNHKIPLKMREYKLNVVVINDYTAALQDRVVNFFSDNSLVVEKLEPRESNASKSEVSGSNLFNEIASVTNSKKLNQLIKNLFNADGSISLVEFHELNQRISENKNIDDCDDKKIYLGQKIKLAKEYFSQDEFDENFADIQKNARDDINFFKEANFIKTVVAPPQMAQGFIRRNLGATLLLSVSLLALVGALAVLTGALAPLGIAVVGSAGLLGGVAAAAGAAILGFVATVRMRINEQTFTKNKLFHDDAQKKIASNSNKEEAHIEQMIEHRTKVDEASKHLGNELNVLNAQFTEEDKLPEELHSELHSESDSDEAVFNQALEQGKGDLNEAGRPLQRAPALASNNKLLSVEEIVPDSVLSSKSMS